MTGIRVWSSDEAPPALPAGLAAWEVRTELEAAEAWYLRLNRLHHRVAWPESEEGAF